MEINHQIHSAIFQFITNFKRNTKYVNEEQQLGEWLEYHLNIPRFQREEFKKYRHTQPQFCKSNIILPKNFTAIVHEPFGSQSKPDLAIFHCWRVLMIDVKTSKTGKPVYNSVPPRTDEFIIYVNTKTGCEQAFAVSGADLLGDVDVSHLAGNANNLHNVIHSDFMSSSARTVNETILKSANISFYGRGMYNARRSFKQSSPKFFEDLMKYDWSVVSLPDVNSFEEEHDE